MKGDFLSFSTQAILNMIICLIHKCFRGTSMSISPEQIHIYACTSSQWWKYELGVIHAVVIILILSSEVLSTITGGVFFLVLLCVFVCLFLFFSSTGVLSQTNRQDAYEEKNIFCVFFPHFLLVSTRRRNQNPREREPIRRKLSRPWNSWR